MHLDYLWDWYLRNPCKNPSFIAHWRLNLKRPRLVAVTVVLHDHGAKLPQRMRYCADGGVHANGPQWHVIFSNVDGAVTPHWRSAERNDKPLMTFCVRLRPVDGDWKDHARSVAFDIFNVISHWYHGAYGQVRPEDKVWPSPKSVDVSKGSQLMHETGKLGGKACPWG